MTYFEDDQIYKKLSYYKTKPRVICNKTNKQKIKPRIAATEKPYPAQDDTDDVLKQSIISPNAMKTCTARLI